jgi:hypothetical protein
LQNPSQISGGSQQKNPSQISGGSQQNIRHETSRTSRNKTREYLKGKTSELEYNNKDKNM